MAMFIPRAKGTPTFVGMIAGALTAFLISFSNEVMAVNISFLWNIPGSFIVGVLVSGIGSYLIVNSNSNKVRRVNDEK